MLFRIVYVEYDSSNNAKTMVEDYDNFVAFNTILCASQIGKTPNPPIYSFKGQYYMYDDLLNDPDFRTEQDMQVVVLIGLKCKITYDDPLNATPADSWFTEISPEDTVEQLLWRAASASEASDFAVYKQMGIEFIKHYRLYHNNSAIANDQTVTSLINENLLALDIRRIC